MRNFRDVIPQTDFNLLNQSLRALKGLFFRDVMGVMSK